jgi:stearoyl-CoA desaturase (Delta-9 desaturase)
MELATAPAAADRGTTRWWPPTPFILVHLAALATLFVGFRWYYPVIALVSYYVRMFWVTIGYHRYFSHRAYRTSRPFQFVLACLAMTSAQNGVLWWAANHRDHHKHADGPEDLHSPHQSGLWWSHVGWILSDRYNATNLDRVRDFARYPELRWLNRWHWVPVALYFLALWCLGSFPIMIWGGVVATVLLWHGSFTVNSLAHLFGSRRYDTPDGSRNSWWLALLTCGEGWHNNHHHYQSSANQGWRWWQVDASYYGLKVMSWLRLVSDLRLPPAHVVNALAPEKQAPPPVTQYVAPKEGFEPPTRRLTAACSAD